MKTGVLLMAFGGPETVDQVGLFMSKLIGRVPPPGVVDRVAERYRAIGGGSPLPDIVRAQACELQSALSLEVDSEIEVRAAFRYVEPSIDQAVRELAGLGCQRMVGVSDSPHFSRVTTGAYRQAFRAAAAAACVWAVDADPYYAEPSFLDGIAAQALAARNALSEPQQALLLFTAHSLPVEHVEGGDPYVHELRATVYGVLERLPKHDWELAYQSKGMGQGAWLEPTAESVLEREAAAGRQSVMLVPVGFTCEHVETLYDIDVLIAGKARELGMSFSRARALDTHPKLIAALAASVRPHLQSA